MHPLESAIREQAEWRETKAAEYPDDERNARSAMALGELAEIANSLESGEDPRTLYLTRFHFTDGVPIWGEATHRELSRWGFDGKAAPTAEEADRFVGRMCALAASDMFNWISDCQGDWGQQPDVDGIAGEHGLLPVEVESALHGGTRWESSFASYEDPSWLAKNILGLMTPESVVDAHSTELLRLAEEVDRVAQMPGELSPTMFLRETSKRLREFARRGFERSAASCADEDV